MFPINGLTLRYPFNLSIPNIRKKASLSSVWICSFALFSFLEVWDFSIAPIDALFTGPSWKFIFHHSCEQVSFFSEPFHDVRSNFLPVVLLLVNEVFQSYFFSFSAMFNSSFRNCLTCRIVSVHHIGDQPKAREPVSLNNFIVFWTFRLHPTFRN